MSIDKGLLVQVALNPLYRYYPGGWKPAAGSTNFPTSLPGIGGLIWFVTRNRAFQNAGWPKLRFNASGLASGMYFCRVTAEGLERSGHYAATSKMLLLK